MELVQKAVEQEETFSLVTDGNPFERPPQSVVRGGWPDALGWFKDINRFGETTSNRLKMVMVGLAEAGKTTIVRNLINDSSDGETGSPDRTVGVEIHEWQPADDKPLKVSIWDFAGQADYYASHQIFLTRGGLFVLVVDLFALSEDSAKSGSQDPLADPHGRVYRWLHMLDLRVPGAVVTLVGTHADKFKGIVERTKAVDRFLSRKYDPPELDTRRHLGTQNLVVSNRLKPHNVDARYVYCIVME